MKKTAKKHEKNLSNAAFLRKSFTLDVKVWLFLLFTKSKISRNPDSSHDQKR